jgi:hypothetical protein
VNDFVKEHNIVRKLYRDLIKGFTTFHLEHKSFSFKHLSESEICASNEVYIREFDNAKMQGLLSTSDKIKLLCRDKVWSEDKEKEIDKISEEIALFQSTLKKLVIQSQVKKMRNDINEKQELLNSIIKERDELLGLTAENFAQKKSNEFIIYYSLYKDDLKTPLFKNQDEFAEGTEVELIEYINCYKEFISMFKIENIKRIAVCGFFMNTFFLCEDNPNIFYGKPIINLTQYQCDLFALGRNYKHYLTKSGEHPPNNVKKLDDLVAWYENRQNIANLKEQNQDKMGQSYIGATKEELKTIAANSTDEVVDLSEEAKKAGNGDLSFEQILKIHGI